MGGQSGKTLVPVVITKSGIEMEVGDSEATEPAESCLELMDVVDRACGKHAKGSHTEDTACIDGLRQALAGAGRCDSYPRFPTLDSLHKALLPPPGEAESKPPV